MRVYVLRPVSCLLAIFIGICGFAQSSKTPVTNPIAQSVVQGLRSANLQEAFEPFDSPRLPEFKSPIMRRLFQSFAKHSQNSHSLPLSPGTLNSPFLTTPPLYAMTSSPLGIALGDFNSDKKQDVVVAANPPQLLLGNGDGTLQTALPIGNTAASDVAVGDFNHDGNLDAAFAIGGAALVYLGNGDGTFNSGTTFSSGGTNNDGLAHIIAADVNNDGITDLILNTDTGVTVLLGNGNGTFQAPIASSASFAVLSMVSADFNKDGHLDLAVTDGFSTLEILLGNGRGNFSTAGSYKTTTFSNLNAIASGDFNRDGNADVALPNGQVFLGNGHGTLSGPSTFETAPGAQVVSAVDVNGDGIPDLVTVSSLPVCGDANFGTTGVSLGNGDGTFQPATIFDSGGCSYPAFIGIGDLNGDGFFDLVVGSGQQSSFLATPQLSILLNLTNGTFPAAQLATSGGSGGVATGDFNHDGNLDVAMADGSVYLGNGNGTLQFRGGTASLGGVQVQTAEFSHDNNLDLAAAVECVAAGCSGGGALAIALGNGDGSFLPATALPSGGFYSESLVIADFNHDGKPDVAILNNCVNLTCIGGGSVTVFLGNGNGTFAPGNTIALPQSPYGGNPMTIVAGDFNNDGSIDLAAFGCSPDCMGETGVANVLFGNGDGTFQPPIVSATGTGGVTGAAAGDFNQDGILDVAVANGGVCSDCDGHGTFLYGNGDCTFTAGAQIGTDGGPPVSIVAADFYGAGSPTPVLGNYCGDTLDCPGGSVMINGTDNLTDIMLQYLAVGDFNNDGKPDLAGSLQFNAGASVLLNVGSTLAATTTLLSPAAPRSYSVFQPVIFTARVQHSGPQLPTGLINFLDNGVSIGSASLAADGEAAFATTRLNIGSHFVIAYYAGDSSSAASNSLGAHLTITRSATTPTLASSRNPSPSGQKITFTVTISGLYGGNPAGHITFKDGNRILKAVPLSRGTAQYSTESLTQGQHRIGADFSGDAEFLPTSAALIQTVQ